MKQVLLEMGVFQLGFESSILLHQISDFAFLGVKIGLALDGPSPCKVPTTIQLRVALGIYVYCTYSLSVPFYIVNHELSIPCAS